jgi:ketosteroid isomerase-like protein
MEREIQENLAAWNRHDAAATVAMCADDCVLHVNGQPVQGRDAMQAVAQGYFDTFPDLRMEFTSVWIDGRTALEEWQVVGTNAQTGERTEVMGLGLDQFGEDGKVHRSAVYFDSAALTGGAESEQQAAGNAAAGSAVT